MHACPLRGRGAWLQPQQQQQHRSYRSNIFLGLLATIFLLEAGCYPSSIGEVAMLFLGHEGPAADRPPTGDFGLSYHLRAPRQPERAS